MPRLLSRAAPLAALVCLAQSSFAQTANGSISGIVTDSTGAVVPEAAIRITDLDRNVTLSSVSNQTGLYAFPSLPPGSYRLVAEKAGFRKYTLDQFRLRTQQAGKADITLEVGAVTESVEVTGQAQLLEPGSAALGAVVENKRILDLPLNGRNVLGLASLVPGVFFARPLSSAGEQDFRFTSGLSVNGGQPGMGELTLDGVTATTNDELTSNRSVSILPSVEGVQEFRIQTNAYSAEYGRSGGGIITMASKSGANQVHGSLFEYLRNTELDANTFFNNRNGVLLRNYKQNQFGASAGGPVYLPRLYNGKNRTFFWAVYEGKRIRAPYQPFFNVPTELERQGDFSQTLNQSGALKLVYNPFTTRPNPDRPGRYLRDPFPGNRVPSALMDPVALAVQSYYPKPNLDGDLYTRTRNYFNPKSRIDTSNRYEFKVDHNLDPSQRVFGRYTTYESHYGKPNVWGNVADPNCCNLMRQRLTNAVGDYTNTLSPRAVLNVRYGLSRVAGKRFPPSLGFKASQLGLPQSIDQVATFDIFPPTTVEGYSGAGADDIYVSFRTTHQAAATLSLTTGRHSLKAGFDGRANYVNNGQPSGPNGTFSFAAAQTQGPDAGTPALNAGSGWASFLLGVGSSGRISHPTYPAIGNHYRAFFVQDDLKLTRKLTLNLGLRWELENAQADRYDRITAIDPYVRNPISDKVGMDVRGGFRFALTDLGRRRLTETYKRALNPRLGIAYELNSKTAIRTGYGVFFGVPAYSSNSHSIAGGFSTATSWVPLESDGVTPKNPLRNPFPDGWNTPTGASEGLLTGVGTSLYGVYPEATSRPMYNQNWNFTIQRSFQADTLLEVAYAGNKATHLPLINWRVSGLSAAQVATLRDQMLVQVNNPFYGYIPANRGSLAARTIQQRQLLLPWPLWSGVTFFDAGYGNSNYHALQARFEKRYSNGASLLASYTWSKSLSDGQDGFWIAGATTPVRDFTCRRCEYALTMSDQPHRFVANFTYEVPLGRGRRFGADLSRWLDLLIGRWQANGIVTLAAGVPLRITTASNTARTGGTQMPDSTGVNAALPRGQRTIDRWFDTSQFRIPAEYTVGNLGRTHPNLREDWSRNLDASVFKEYRITERLNLQFRMEAFNLTNTPIFAAPDTTIQSGLYGKISATQNTSRQLQGGLKLLF